MPTDTVRMFVRPSDVLETDTIRSVRWGRFEDDPERKQRLLSWDDGSGDLYLYRESLGPCGVVRASTWEDAYGACEDAVFDDATADDIEDAFYGDDAALESYRSGDGNLPECFGYRNNGPTSPLREYVYQTDPNGSDLRPLTDALADEYGIVIEVERDPQDDADNDSGDDIGEDA